MQKKTIQLSPKQRTVVDALHYEENQNGCLALSCLSQHDLHCYVHYRATECDRGCEDRTLYKKLHHVTAPHSIAGETAKWERFAPRNRRGERQHGARGSLAPLD